MADSPKKESNSNEEILRIARERFKLAEEAWKPIYDKGREDLKFLSGDQWDEQDKNLRKSNGRPCLTINRLPQHVHQITNDQRQNSPSIKVSPVDSSGDIDTARIYQGLIRHVENKSNAKAAYNKALDGSVGNSFGFFEIRTEYVSAKSFDQEPRICRVNDPFTVLIDPFFKEPDASDINWGFKIAKYSKDDYVAEFGESKLSEKGADWELMGESCPGWMEKDSVIVAEYYRKEFEKKTLLQLSNGMVIEESDLEIEPLPEGIEIVNKKTSQCPKIIHCKINGSEILEETVFPGIYVPLILVMGKEYFIDGERCLESAIRHAKDSQRSYNVWVSAEAEMIGSMPKAPWLVPRGGIAPELKNVWARANTKPPAFLEYETELNGKPLPPPTRNVYEPPVQALTNARMQSAEDLKSTTGIYDAALGARSNETSGVAIRGRQQQAQTSNFHFIDNLNLAIRHAGRILVSIIPVLFDSARAARIIGDEGEEEIVLINQEFEEAGQTKIYDLGKGEYDVVVESGPSYATKRQETSAQLLDLIKIMPPQQSSVITDIVVESLDINKASAIAGRLKKTLPPGIAEEDGKQSPIPPEVQNQMQQMQQMIEQLTQNLNQANEEIKIKKYEIDSKEKIETMKLENQAAIELAKLQSKEAIEMLFAQIQELDARTKQMSQVPIEQDLSGEIHPDQMSLPEQQQPLMEGQ